MYLAILKINGEQLLEVQDDGGFIKYEIYISVNTFRSNLDFSIMRGYFASLGESAHPNSTDPRTRAITRFQELLLVAFREFSIITDETIQSERRRLRAEIVQSIESFAKRAAIRSLKRNGRFSKDQLGLIYDALFKAICIIPAIVDESTPPVLLQTGAVGEVEQKQETRVGLRTFRIFLSELCSWARDETVIRNGFQVRLNINYCEYVMH